MKTLFLIGLSALTAWGQKLEFEVASVRAAAPPQAQQLVNLGLHLDGAQARIVNFALKDYIAMAYRIKVYQISGPDSLSDRYDLTAKLPAGATADQIPEMLQTLLSDRFGLKLHREKKDMPVYALVQGKPPLKLKEEPAEESDDSAPGTNVAASGSGAGVSVDLGHGASYTFANNKFEGRKFTMDVLASQLERYLDRPIVNLTDLKGRYDFTLQVTEEDYQAMLIRAAIGAGLVLPPQVRSVADTNSAASLQDAIRDAGLKLDPRKAPLDFLVIDQARKAPTDN